MKIYVITVFLYFLVWSNMTSYLAKSYLGPSNSFQIGTYLDFLLSMFYLSSKLIKSAKKILVKKVLYNYKIINRLNPFSESVIQILKLKNFS